MLILSFDSAGFGCSACLWQDGVILSQRHEVMERGQDARLIPMIMEMIKKTNITFTMLDMIATAQGPGSFTGIRIGLSTARAMGLASGKPTIGINRFDIYRTQYADTKNLGIILDSRREEFYCQFPNQPIPEMLSENQIADRAQKENLILVGDAKIATIQGAKILEVCTMAELASKANPSDTEFQPIPFYIRPPDVTMKKK